MEENNKCSWFYVLKSRSPFSSSFIYIDTCTFIADRIFNDAGVKVSKVSVLHRPGEDYRVIVAKCRKKDFGKVLDAIDLLPSKALICGWFGYMDYANGFLKDVTAQTEKNGGSWNA